MIQKIVAYSGLINAVTSIILGCLVLIKSHKMLVSRIFGIFCFCVACWSLAYFKWASDLSYENSLYWNRLSNLFAAIIPMLFTAFTLSFVGKRNWEIHILNSAICFSIILFYLTPFYVLDMQKTDYLVYYPVPGPLFHVMSLYFFGNVIYAYYLLWFEMKQTIGLRRRQVQYVFYGTLVGFFGGSTNFLLLYDIPIPPVLNIFVSVYVVAVAYAIVRYRFMGIQLTSQDKEKLKTMLAVTGSVNHEIRNPLSFVQADAKELLGVIDQLDEQSLRAKAKAVLSRIEEQSRHVIEVTKTMTRYARPVKDKIEFEPVDIRHCVDAAVGHFKGSKESSDRIEITVSDEGDGGKVLGDHVFVEESIRNFLENAAYGIRQSNVERGEIKVRIYPDARKRIAFSVTDNGCGIPKEELTRVFDMDYSTRRDGFKHGAGLFLVKWYADQMKAELNIESTVGVGTTVSMSLPRAASKN